MRKKLSDERLKWYAVSAGYDECGTMAAEVIELRARLAEYEQDSATMPDNEKLDFEIDLLENFESDGETDYAQLICWLKELQRRRASMLAKQAPTIPDEVIEAICKVARIRVDFDRDRRGNCDCLDEAEQELIVTVTKHAHVLANGDKGDK